MTGPALPVSHDSPALGGGAPRGRTRRISALLAVARSPFAVWAAFVLVHLWLGLLNLYAPGLPLGDVTIVYRSWIEHAYSTGVWVGIDTIWVYPVLALVPMLLASLFGPDQFGSTWLSMVMILNAVAFGFLTGWGRSRERTAVAWWWLAFLLLLGPIALGRIDSVTVPVAIVGVLLLASRERVAAILLTVAMWVKVWPAALLAAVFIALRGRWRILLTVLLVSIGIMLVALLLGSGGNVLSFITQQAGRGLQVEAPVSTFWMWQALAGAPDAFVYYDRQILTYQVQGEGVELVGALMTPLLALVVLGIALLGIRAVRAGASVGDLLPPLSLAFVTSFIAVNKVGSPQFIAWLAVPIVLGLATSAAGRGGSFRVPATLALVIAGLTQLFYPYLYWALLHLNPLLLGALTLRNVLEFVLLGWAVLAVVRSPHAPGDDALHPGRPASVWPLGSHRESLEPSDSAKE